MSETRADWEKHKNYPPRWSWATWPERAGIVGIWIAAGIAGIVIAGGILLVVGESLDGVSRYNSEHRRCLQHATNGAEIEHCR